MKILRLLKILDNSFSLKVFQLLFLLLFGSILEMLGLSLIVPLLAAITDFENIEKYTNFLNFFFNFSGKSYFEFIFFISCVIGITYLVKNSILFYINYFQLNFVKLFNIQLGQKLFRKYLSNDFSFFLGKNSSVFIRNLTTDQNLLSQSIINYALILLEIFIILSILILLFFYNFKTTISLLIIFTLLVLFFFVISKKKIKNWSTERMSSENLKIKILKESLNFIREIKLYNLTSFFTRSFGVSNKQFSSVMFKHVFLQASVRLILEFLAVSMVLSGIIILSYSSEINTIIPTIGLYVAAAFRLIPSINKVITSFQQIRFVKPILENFLEELHQTKHQKFDVNNNKKVLSFSKYIEFKDVTFGHDDRDCIFDNFNIKIKKGSFTVITGESGIGKSTLVDMLAGFIIPKKGKILIDGKNNLKDEIIKWQNNIAYTISKRKGNICVSNAACFFLQCDLMAIVFGDLNTIAYEIASLLDIIGIGIGLWAYF